MLPKPAMPAASVTDRPASSALRAKYARWNAGSESGRIGEIITPGGFENYFRKLGELLLEHANDPVGKPLHELPERGELADKYGLTYGSPDWMHDITGRYGLNPPSH